MGLKFELLIYSLCFPLSDFALPLTVYLLRNPFDFPQPAAIESGLRFERPERFERFKLGGLMSEHLVLEIFSDFV